MSVNYIKKILNDFLLLFSAQIYKFYSIIFAAYVLPPYYTFRSFIRKTSHISLPQNDSDLTARFIELERTKTFYHLYDNNGYFPGVTTELFTNTIKEFYLNLIAAGPLLFFSVFDFFDDGRYLKSAKEILFIEKLLGLPKTVPKIDDYTAYERTTGHDLIEKITSEKRKFITNRWRDKHGLYDYLDKHKELYGHDVVFLGEFYNDIGYFGLFEPYMDGEKKRLRITYVMMYDWSTKQEYVFNWKMPEWPVIRILYVNIIKSQSSFTYHQLCSNIYNSYFLYLIRTNLSTRHPIHAMMDPFLEGTYNTNAVFNSMGISIYNKNFDAFRRYMERTQIFDSPQGEEMSKLMTYFYEQTG
jgi:hypothetical protein